MNCLSGNRYLTGFILLLGILISSRTFAQPSNDACSNILTISTNGCATYNIKNAASTDGAGACGSATTTTTYDMWFRFQATATSTTITLSIGNPTNMALASTYVQILQNGTCGAMTPISCSNAASAIPVSGLTIGSLYVIRVYVTSIPNLGNASQSNRYDYTMCVEDPPPPPANNECAAATALSSGTSCSNTAGTLAGATASSPAVATSCGTAGADVWYSFIAPTAFPTISLSSIGTSLSGAGVSMQLFSGTCGALTSIACTTGNASTLSLNTSTNPGGSGLVAGNTYYIRIYTPTAVPTGTGWGFNICITRPTPSQIDYSRSYINVTKGGTGGTVNPGDTLEMRATIVIRGTGSSADSLSFTDTLYHNRGLRLVPGSVSLRTNEGKVYKSFTDADDSDAGWLTYNGLDTIISMNFGTVASRYARGRLNYNSRPSVFGSTCIIMATYRVVVYADYNSTINFKTGSLHFRDVLTGTSTKANFTANNLIVYQSPGLCPNAVSATNALGAEFNGTFGAPSGGAPLARNRGTTPYTSYLYNVFANGTGPGDLYYGITNNTSGRYTTITTWTKPESVNGYRVFNQWDITGDHTNSADPLKGNLACDTTQPVSATNPCGYMLVINSAYKPDTAFTYTVNNLCPNTYYEIAAWFKNICYKCGCDSTGTSVTGATYIPSAPGDSSGVQPNVAFDVNGIDYYTTGNIAYAGLGSQTGSDTLNRWVKRGFVYLTGPAETSFRLTLRNNAPGGGGNDWALDDISVATCLPNMQYSPSLSPTTCESNPITINDTIRSYFNNYNNYRWQRSTDGGSNWSDVPAATGTSSPTWNGSAWEYITSYTIPPSGATLSNNGDRYRVVVSTTSGNLGNSNCQVTDGISIINLNVLNCGVALQTELLSFNGRLVNGQAQLSWNTSREEEQVYFNVEKSPDGRNFTSIGTVKGFANRAAETNSYSFTDSALLNGKASYRITMHDNGAKRKMSRIIQLQLEESLFTVNHILNPFGGELPFEIATSKDGRMEAVLLNASGSAVGRQAFTLRSGINSVSLDNLQSLTPGIYILKIQYRDQTYSRKVIKK